MATRAEEPPRAPTPIISSSTVKVSREVDVTVWVYSLKNVNKERTLTRFQIQREALTSHSDYSTNCFIFIAQNGDDPYNLHLKDDDVGAMRVWFEYLQAVFEKEQAEQYRDRPSKRVKMDSHSYTTSLDEEAMFGRDGVHDTDICRIWHIINAADKYMLDASILEAFFGIWYRKNVRIMELDSDFARQVALPCYMFNHAIGFAEVTRWLAYNHAGYITEKRPKVLSGSICVSPLVNWCPMNHARGALKSCIHRGIWEKVGDLLTCGPRDCTCGHWAATAGHYFATLVKTGGYPLEKTFSKASVNDILTCLKSFNMPSASPGTLCNVCMQDWDKEISNARVSTIKYFDGLCIDCMDRSRPKHDDNADLDYWRQCEAIDGRWDHNCRVRHDEPTWYVSWCGRGEYREKLLNQYRMEKFRRFHA